MTNKYEIMQKIEDIVKEQINPLAYELGKEDVFLEIKSFWNHSFDTRCNIKFEMD